MARPKKRISQERIKKLSKNRKSVLPDIKEEELRASSGKKWTFSFQYWEQRKFFGLKYENVSKEWFISLLESLRSLSSKLIDDVRLDGSAKKAHRFHLIDWNNCAISKDKFYSYIPPDYKTDETDVLQFQIEKSKGRVIGFFDVKSTFQIVLLDPAHNMQLSKQYGYTTVKTNNLQNSYDNIVAKFASIIKKSKSLNPGEIDHFIKEVKSILVQEGYPSDRKMVIIDEHHLDAVNEILQHNDNYENLDDVVYDALKFLKYSQGPK